MKKEPVSFVWLCLLTTLVGGLNFKTDAVAGFASSGSVVRVSITNSVWRLWRGLSEASLPDTSAWRFPEFSDAGWASVPAPLYYTSSPTEPPFYDGGPITGTVLNDMLNSYSCVFLRNTFLVTNAALAGDVTIQVACDDGFAVWLNGVEVARTNLPPGPLTYTGRAIQSLPEPYPIHVIALNPGTHLREGTNVLAVQAFNWDAASGDFGIMAGLSTLRDVEPPVLIELQPPPGLTVSELTAVAVRFSEVVTSVKADDLLINGVPATEVHGFEGFDFVFTFAQPTAGDVTLAWSANQGIHDLGGNPFAGGEWNCRLDPNRLGTPIISEFMANNDGTLLDGNGEPSDWIEIHNPTESPVNLAGWKLRDSETDWIFPAEVIPAGAYEIIFASGRMEQPFVDAKGYLHTNFKLALEGESLSLQRPDGTVVSSYATPGPQRKGVSFGVVQTTTNLTTYESPARLLVPDAALPNRWWADVDFDDRTWIAGQGSAGFGRSEIGTVAYRVHPGTPGSQDYPGALGMDFVVNRKVVVTELGCFDDNSDGLRRTINVQLWRRDDRGTPTSFADDTGAGVLASMAFTAGDSGALVEGSRFKSLPAPITLTPGSYTIVASGYGFDERNGNLGNGPPPEPWETQSGGGALSFVGLARPGAAGTFPTTVDAGPANRYAAGTFRFSEPDGPVPYTPLASVMQGVSATALMRVRFNVGNAAAFDSLTLNLSYDDGCVVWLNGVEVARRNAPAVLLHDSVATAAASRVERLPLAAGLLVNGTNILAVQGLNLAANDSDYFMGAYVSATDSTTTNVRYFAQPTPGAPNTGGFVGYVADTVFSVKRGFFDAPFDLAISSATAGAIIRYTLDGSLPTETNGTIYNAPLRIGSTAVVRAIAYKAGLQSANVDTHTYLFANDVAVQASAPPPGYPASWTDYTAGGSYTADYGMINPASQPQNYARAAGNSAFTMAQARAALSNSVKALPVVSIVTDKAHLFDPATGIYLHPNARGEAWERPISVEFISTNRLDSWHARAGLHIMGLTSRFLSVTPKLNLMLVFNSDYGEPWLTEPFFGTDGPSRIKRIALRTNTRESWLYEENGFGTGTYIVDGFAKDSLRESGEPATRHRYCHVFLNGLYWGVYNPTERPESHWAETTFGGEDEDYDVINLCCPNRIDAGSFAPWQQLLSSARAGLSSAVTYQAIQGNNPDGTRNPALQQLLGVDSLIGFMINGYYHASLDWPDNFFAIFDHVGNRTAGWRFVTWDTDLGFANFDPNYNKVVPPEGLAVWASHDSAFAVEASLRQNAEYRLRVADRVYREFFHHGAYVTATNLSRWQRLRDAILPGLYAESARWGDYKPGGLRTVQEHWLPRVNGPAALAWFGGRNAALLSQLRAASLYPPVDPPEFNQDGGRVSAGFPITLSQSSPGGIVFVTFDGSDPRLPGGSVAPGAQAYSQPIVLTRPTLLRARVRNNSVWSALNQAQFYPSQDFNRLQLSEIMYNPPGAGSVDGEEFEFVELRNTGTLPLELSGVRFQRGITFVFTNETTLGPGQYFVLARNLAQFAARYPGAPVHGVYSGKLDNNGETLELVDGSGAPIFSVKYDNAAPWAAEADNSGLSLQRLSFAANPTNALAWAAAEPTPGGAPPIGFEDSDNNGLSDEWERIYSITVAEDDPDGDGLTNLEEFRAGTNPRDEDDALRMRSIEVVPGSGSAKIALSFSARSNRTYSILYRPSTSPAAWSTLRDFAAERTNRLISVTNEIKPDDASVFFRLTTPKAP